MELMVSGVAVLFLLGLRTVVGRGPHHPHAPHVHYRPSPGSPKLTQDSSLLQDTEHIQEDLGKTMKIDLEKMSPEELEFHYFKIHDYDNNTKLDGLEILQAIRHTVDHNSEKYLEGTTQKPFALRDDFSYFVELIDQVLDEDDYDKDGFLSYAEYMTGRQRDSNRRKALQH